MTRLTPPLTAVFGALTQRLQFMNWPLVILVGLMINSVILVIATRQGLCIEAVIHSTGLTFYWQLRPAIVFTVLDTDPLNSLHAFTSGTL
jgi:hypothetical protein